LQDTRIDPDFVVMAHPVSVADYTLCVADGACDEADSAARAPNMPVTGVSFDDAEAYAQWLTKTTGHAWRLPTDEEWAFFAGSRFADDALGLDDDDGANPADRWLAAYQRETELSGEGSMPPQPIGSEGSNEFGIGDLSGAVWEWTQTCYARVTVDAAGRELTRIDSCGVRIVEGRHRAAMSGFIRDARSGGCTAGRPPDNLGFRLVRDTDWRSTFQVWMTRLFG
jgi:formylglycine-generating enzyme required for sulfatase activity